MNTNSQKISGFMSAESIYSLAFYIVMVAAIAGVGAGVLSKADSAKAASAISILRANFIAEGATLGYPPLPALPAAAAAHTSLIVRLSGGLIPADAAGTSAILPGGGAVTMALRSTTFPFTGFSINITGINKTDVCTAIGGVGYGTWSAFSARSSGLPASNAAINTIAAPWTTKSATKNFCNNASTVPVNMIFASY